MRFADATELVPEPCQVFGTPLRPFCLGHHLLLRRLVPALAGCPMAEASPEEILVAVAICGASYDWTMGELLTGRWPDSHRKWLRGVTGPWYRRRKINRIEAEVFYREYLMDGYKLAPLWRHTSASRIDLSAPWECLLETRLVQAGYPLAEVQSGYMPAQWYRYWTVAELRQLETIKDEKDWRRIFYRESDARALDAVRGN